MAYTVLKSLSVEINGVSVWSLSLDLVKQVNTILKEDSWVSDNNVLVNLVRYLEDGVDLDEDLSKAISSVSTFLSSDLYSLKGDYSVVNDGDNIFGLSFDGLNSHYVKLNLTVESVIGEYSYERVMTLFEIPDVKYGRVWWIYGLFGRLIDLTLDNNKRLEDCGLGRVYITIFDRFINSEFIERATKDKEKHLTLRELAEIDKVGNSQKLHIDKLGSLPSELGDLTLGEFLDLRDSYVKRNELYLNGLREVLSKDFNRLLSPESSLFLVVQSADISDDGKELNVVVELI